jgi:predicted nucleic acid-binding protein
MSGDFVDSNVIIYSLQHSDPRKQEIARHLIRDTSSEGMTISFQVVSETLNALTQKFSPQMPADEAQTVFVEILRPLWRANPSPALYGRALVIKGRYGYSFYDSLIIAAALEAGCDRLFSEDLQHGQRIEGLTIVNPFLDS